MFLERLDKLSDRIYRRVGKSRLFAHLHEAEGVKQVQPNGRSAAFYRSVLLWQEQGFFFRIKRKLYQAFLGSRCSDIGIFLVIWGVVSLLGNSWFYGANPFSGKILFSLMLILSASVLLRISQFCGKVIRNSLFFRWLLFDFCELSESLFLFKKKKKRTGIWVLFGFLAGGASVLFSPIAVGGLMALCCLMFLFSAVPELLLLTIFGGLPFLNLFPHPTMGLVGLLLIGVTVCAGKAISGKRQIVWRSTDRLAVWFGILFFFGGLISHGRVWDGILRGFLMLSAWFCTRLLFSSQIWRRRAIATIILSSVCCACMGILQYVLGKAELGWVDIARFGDIGGRVTAFFGNPNLFAIYLLYTAIICLGMIFCNLSRWETWIWCGSFFTISLCLVLTWSRGAWLAWLFAISLFLALCSRRSLSILFALGVTGGGLIFYLPHSVTNRFRSIGNLADSSANYRIYTWKGVLRMLQANPWGIGCGEGAFRAVYPQYAVSGTEGVMHAHQIFLEVFVELGLGGFLLFLTLLWVLLKNALCFFKCREEGARRAEGVSLLCVLIGGLVMGCFDSLWYHSGLFWMFWSMCALLAGLNGEGRHESE